MHSVSVFVLLFATGTRIGAQIDASIVARIGARYWLPLLVFLLLLAIDVRIGVGAAGTYNVIIELCW